MADFEKLLQVSADLRGEREEEKEEDEPKKGKGRRGRHVSLLLYVPSAPRFPC